MVPGVDMSRPPGRADETAGVRRGRFRIIVTLLGEKGRVAWAPVAQSETARGFLPGLFRVRAKGSIPSYGLSCSHQSSPLWRHR